MTSIIFKYKDFSFSSLSNPNPNTYIKLGEENFGGQKTNRLVGRKTRDKMLN